VRILLLTPVPPERDGRGAIPALLYAQLVGLSLRNEVTLVCVAGPDPAEIEAAERLRSAGFDVHPVVRRAAGGRSAWERRLRLAHGWLVLRRPWRTVWFADAGVQPVLDRLLAEREFDVAAVEDDAMGVYSFGERVPAVLTVHELGRTPPLAASGRLRRLHDLLAQIDWRRWPRYQHAVCRRFAMLAVFTEADRARVAALDPSLAERVRVTPFGIELPALPDVDVEEPDSLVFAGNYSHPPNVDAAVWLAEDIFPRVQARRPQARLKLVGVNMPPRMRTLAALPGVELVGEVPTLDPVLARAALIMAPIRTGGGMRMKVLHAMAAGRAVVTTPLGAAGLEGDATPPLAVAGDAAGLAAAAADLLADDAARRALGTRARTFVEQRHGSDAVARRLEAVYTEAIGLAHSKRRAAA
jgi:polysaccharide biosynthesis protein PslH